MRFLAGLALVVAFVGVTVNARTAAYNGYKVSADISSVRRCAAFLQLLWGCCEVVVGLLWGCCGVVVGLLWGCCEIVVGCCDVIVYR